MGAPETRALENVRQVEDGLEISLVKLHAKPTVN
jgi:hypothetical protein